MTVVLRLAGVCLVFAWATTSTLLVRAEDPAEFKILASFSFPQAMLVRLKTHDSGAVIRSREELAQLASDRKLPTADLESELVRRLEVARIDWTKQMVLAVQGHPSRGEYGVVKFGSLTVADKVLRINWKQENRVSRASFQGPPTGLALVERFEGKVKFTSQQSTNSLGMQLVHVPAGKFLMGSPQQESHRLDDELQHEVEITKPFLIGKYEVTFGQFRTFVDNAKYLTAGEKDGTGGRAFDGTEFIKKPEFTWKNLHFEQADDSPVTVVSWDDAVAFCAWLSKKEGRTYRLPTEAEWEYACRAGSKTRFHGHERDNELFLLGNIADASLKQKWAEMTWSMPWHDGFPFTSPVGQFQANAFGLFDMHGNVWEWCSDWYGEKYYSKSPQKDPPGPSSGNERIARGGAWSTQPKFCRSAFRDWHEPGYRSDCVGFRVVAEE